MRRWVLLLVMAIVVFTQAATGRSARAASGVIDQLNAACNGGAGFGAAIVSGDLVIAGESGSITFPCDIFMDPASSLTLDGTSLVTQQLVVMESDQNSTGANLFIQNGSALTGAAGAGLLVQLRHAADSIVVKNSTIDYPLSVWLHAVGVGEPDAGGGSVDVEDSTLRASDPNGDGIDAVATEESGVAVFARDTMETAARGGVPVLYAGSCRMDTVTGALPACGPPAASAASGAAIAPSGPQPAARPRRGTAPGSVRAGPKSTAKPRAGATATSSATAGLHRTSTLGTAAAASPPTARAAAGLPAANTSAAVGGPVRPSARGVDNMAYHPASNSIVLFGGNDAQGLLGDTWTWSGGAWSQAAPAASPAARWYSTMAQSPDGSLMLFGGNSDPNDSTTGVMGDMWSWNGANWRPLATTSGPGPRERAAMAYDPVRNRTVLFGGADSSHTTFSDTWLWDGANWTSVQNPIHPSTRIDGKMAFDAAHGNMVLFGGLDDFGKQLHDTWVWDGSRWRQVPAVSWPPAALFVSLSYDPATKSVVLFGGDPACVNGFCNTPVSDTWQWDGANWHQLSSFRWPHARLVAGMAADNSNIVLFGGELPAPDYDSFTYSWDGSWHTAQGPDRPKYVAFGDSLTTGSSVASCSADRSVSLWGCNDLPTMPAIPYPTRLAQDANRGFSFNDDPAYFRHHFFPLVDHPDLDLYRVGIWGYSLAEAVRDDSQGFNGNGPTDRKAWTPQLEAVRMAQSLVTGALGINDLDFSNFGLWAPLRLADLELALPGGSRVQAEADRRMQALDDSGAFNALFLSLDQAHANGATIVLVLYYNPLAGQPSCVFATPAAQQLVNTVNNKLRQFASQRPWIRLADTNTEMAGHGAGSAQPWVFGRSCDGGRLISTSFPGWLVDPAVSVGPLVVSAQQEFDPHPTSDGTAAQALAVRKALGEV